MKERLEERTGRVGKRFSRTRTRSGDGGGGRGAVPDTGREVSVGSMGGGEAVVVVGVQARGGRAVVRVKVALLRAGGEGVELLETFCEV